MFPHLPRICTDTRVHSFPGNRGWNAPPPGQGYGPRANHQPDQHQQQQQQPYGNQGYGQQQGFQGGGGGRLPSRPGLGSSGYNGGPPSNSPYPQQGGGGGGGGYREPESFKLFVGSLAAGVDDAWLEKLLGVSCARIDRSSSSR